MAIKTEEKKALIKFIETSPAFNKTDKLKLILFLSGLKPATYVHLKIAKNLHDKHDFEKLLKRCNVLFKTSRAKGYEEIVKVSGNKALWNFEGTWYGYDLFKGAKEKRQFETYINLVKSQKHKQADLIAGKLYGYPSCCIKNFISEHDARNIAKKYKYYEFYKKLHDSDKAFPFIIHTPCSTKCRSSASLNMKFKETIKKSSLRFYKEYTKKNKLRLQAVIDIENDLFFKGKSVWPVKDGHDYILISKKPINKKYYLISWLTKETLPRGTIIEADVMLQCDYGKVSKIKEKGFVKNFHHERKFIV